jgi:hypothetical protein
MGAVYQIRDLDSTARHERRVRECRRGYPAGTPDVVHGPQIEVVGQCPILSELRLR